MPARTSATENLGPHLLGRKPLPEDTRDYQLADYLDAHDRMASSLTADTTLGELQAAGPLDVWHDVYAFWAWFKQHILSPTPPPPTPPAPPPAGGVTQWKYGPISDQGQTPHCVGFTGLDWGNCEPVNDQWPNLVGDKLYYECKVIDGEPGAEDGSHSRSLCKALKARGRIGAYAFASSADVAAAYVLGHGPVGIGVDWYNDMFQPASPHFILSLTGGVAGGHEISLAGYDSSSKLFTLVNHWGSSWAHNGVAYLRHDDLDRLLAAGGDCWAGLELPL